MGDPLAKLGRNAVGLRRGSAIPARMAAADELLETFPRRRHEDLPPARRVRIALDRGFHDPDFTEAEAAAAAGISQRRLRYLLAAEDTTYREQILKLRMHRAEELLSGTNYLIANIARLCGYRCPSTFTKRFKERYALTPREFRRAKGKSPRAGGITGAARMPSARHRAKKEGLPEPPMHRTDYGWTPGESEAFNAEYANAVRQAQAFGAIPSGGWLSIADTADLRSRKRRRGRARG
jgi:AraC-like DNA-binding protein